MSIESPSQFFNVEKEDIEEEAILHEEEAAKLSGKNFGAIDKEIARLEAKRDKLSLPADSPAIKELMAHIERLKKARDN